MDYRDGVYKLSDKSWETKRETPAPTRGPTWTPGNTLKNLYVKVVLLWTCMEGVKSTIDLRTPNFKLQNSQSVAVAAVRDFAP